MNPSPPTLRQLAYYQTGGCAKHLWGPRDADELCDMMSEIHRDGLDFFLLGAGTNSLVMDEDWDGAVIHFNNMQGHRLSGNSIFVEAGMSNTALAQLALTYSLQGCGWMNRLPGLLGATVRMNARCYGGEISQIVKTVYTVDGQGHKQEYKDSSMFKGYKDTIFMDNGEVIYGALVELETGDPKEIKKKMDFCEQDRVSKGQFQHPSCGCVFKNDYSVGVPSGLLLQEAGVYEIKLNNTMINPHHGNFLFNTGNATSREIIEATLEMRERVYSKFGAWLAYEMEILGAIPSDLRTRLDEVRPHQLNTSALEPLRERFKLSRL